MEIRGIFAGSVIEPAIMGILNITPDSFYDGGAFYNNPEKAAETALQMHQDGAAIIDIGGESTRPGSSPLSADEEMSRVIPVIKAIRKRSDKPLISIDTYKPQTAAEAAAAGADMINDIYAGRFDGSMFRVAAETGAAYVMMHMLKTPSDMQNNPQYSANGAVNDIIQFLSERRDAALSAGIKKENIILDPGIGFGKTYDDNIEIMKRLSELVSLGHPVLAGVSRKSVIGAILDGAPPDKRVFGTAAAVAAAVCAGVSIIRVHDVKEMSEVARTAAVLRPQNPGRGAA